MKIPVYVEPVEHNGFRARSGEPLALTSEGATADEAVQKLQQLVAARLASGGQVIEIDVPASNNPWLRLAGMFKDDPLFDEWQQAIAERRRQIDADPEIP
jgi:hypothetical protein